MTDPVKAAMAHVNDTCSVRRTEMTPNGRMPVGDACGAPVEEVFDDQLVGWINEAWTTHQIGWNGICQRHLEMTPEI